MIGMNTQMLHDGPSLEQMFITHPWATVALVAATLGALVALVWVAARSA